MCMDIGSNNKNTTHVSAKCVGLFIQIILSKFLLEVKWPHLLYSVNKTQTAKMLATVWIKAQSHD